MITTLTEDPLFGSFFKKIQRYQNTIIILLAIMFFSLLAYNYHIDSKEKYNNSAVDYYVQYCESKTNADLSTQERTLTILKEKYAHHIYSSLAVLDQVHDQIQTQKTAEAKSGLDWVLLHSPSSFISDIAHYKGIEIAKNENNEPLLQDHLLQITHKDLKLIGQHLYSIFLAENGRFDEAETHYQSLLNEVSDSAYLALLTREYQVIHRLNS